MFLAEVRKLERDETRGQWHKKAFRGALKIKWVAVDMKRIQWILAVLRKVDVHVCVLEGEEKKTSQAWRNRGDGVSFTEIRNIF